MEDTNQQAGPKWVRREDSAEVYSNQYFLDWSITDVRVRFGQMVPNPDTGTVSYVIEEHAAITLPWPQVKALRDSLNDAVTRYEKANGPMDLPNLKLPT
jgi:hypothetical protein